MEETEYNENYKIDDEDRKQMNEKIKRKYNRTKPSGERTEKQKEHAIRMRKALEDSKKMKGESKQSNENKNVARSQTINKQPIKINKKPNKIIHEDNTPVYREDFESDDDNDNEFIITDNNNVDFIVRPVRKRIAGKKTRKPYIKKEIIEEKINTNRLNNIVETQINAIDKKRQNVAPVKINVFNYFNHPSLKKISFLVVLVLILVSFQSHYYVCRN